MEGAQRGRGFQARNMYTEDTLLDGCCLWGISYTQRIDLLPYSETLDDLLGVDTTWDLYPRNDGDDLGDEPEANDSIDLDGAP